MGLGSLSKTSYFSVFSHGVQWCSLNTCVSISGMFLFGFQSPEIMLLTILSGFFIAFFGEICLVSHSTMGARRPTHLG